MELSFKDDIKLQETLDAQGFNPYFNGTFF